MKYDELLAIVMSMDDADWADHDQLIRNHQSIIKTVRAGAPHCGDCTKQSHTCLVCLVESEELMTDFLIKYANIPIEE